MDDKGTNGNQTSKLTSIDLKHQRHAQASAPPPPSNTIVAKVREVPLMDVKPSFKRSIVSPHVTPFERNKLHFKKLPKVASSEPGSTSQPVTPTSAPPPPPSGRRNSTVLSTESAKSPISVPVDRSHTKSESVIKRKRLKRRKNESDEDDWKPQSTNLESLKPEDISSEGTLYETMYDKIKRRGNKDSGQNEPEVKPDAFKSLLKSRKHKKREHQRRSNDGSDIDECSSDARGRRKREMSKRPPLLTPESPERTLTTKVTKRGTVKKCRLKRPEGDSGSSSESETGPSHKKQPSDSASTKKRKRFVPPVSKRRQRSGGSDSINPEEKHTASKNKSIKRRLGCKVIPSSSSSSLEEEGSIGSYRRGSLSTTATVTPKTAFSPLSPMGGRAASRSASSTPRISRSCSPLNEIIAPGESTADELPLLEKQTDNDDEDDVDVKNLVDIEVPRASPPPELPISEAVVKEETVVAEEVEVSAVELKKEEVPVVETAEVRLSSTEPPADEIKAEEVGPSRDLPVSGLILTSPLIQPSLGAVSTNTSKPDVAECSEESGLDLLSSAAEAEAKKQEETTELSVPIVAQTPPKVALNAAQPVTLLTPVSVIPAPGSTQQHITLVVNAIPKVSTASAESAFPKASVQSTFVLTPSNGTFSLVSPVALSTDNQQLIFNRPALTSTVTPIGQLPDQPQQILQKVSLSTTNTATPFAPTCTPSTHSGNYTQYVQQIMERVKHQDDENTPKAIEKLKRTKKTTQQSPPTATKGVSLIRPAPTPKTMLISNTATAPQPSIKHTIPAATLATAPSDDPYEPNFDEQESEALPKQSLVTAAAVPLPKKSSVDDIITAVLHGELANENYIQCMTPGPAVPSAAVAASSLSPSVPIGCGSEAALIQPGVTLATGAKVPPPPALQQHRPISIAPAPPPPPQASLPTSACTKPSAHILENLPVPSPTVSTASTTTSPTTPASSKVFVEDMQVVNPVVHLQHPPAGLILVRILIIYYYFDYYSHFSRLTATQSSRLHYDILKVETVN